MLYEKRLAQLIPTRRSDRLTSTAAHLDLWCGGDHFCKEWFTLNREYWTRDIDFEIRLDLRGDGKFPPFVGWHNIEVFSILPTRSNEIYVTVLD